MSLFHFHSFFFSLTRTHTGRPCLHFYPTYAPINLHDIFKRRKIAPSPVCAQSARLARAHWWPVLSFVFDSRLLFATSAIHLGVSHKIGSPTVKTCSLIQIRSQPDKGRSVWKPFQWWYRWETVLRHRRGAVAELDTEDGWGNKYHTWPFRRNYLNLIQIDKHRFRFIILICF